MRIELGEYTYLFDEATGKSEALRNGIPWKDTCGDNLLLAMAMKIEELESDIECLDSAWEQLGDTL